MGGKGLLWAGGAGRMGMLGLSREAQLSPSWIASLQSHSYRPALGGPALLSPGFGMRSAL